MSDLLSGVGEGSPPDAFFSSLCEAICRLTSMRRAVLFRYDSARRRVRAVGAHGIELELFAELFVTIDSVPVARQALVEDRVLEVLGADDFEVPPSVRELFEGVRIVCTPMAAAGRYVGVVLSEREAGVPEMDEDERHLLWTLGKAIAMASVAREVTAYDEQSRQLQQRIDLAREIHEGVVQRLFGVSLALSREELLDAEAQRRCAAEVQTALADLRTALQAPARTLLAPDGRDLRGGARTGAGAVPRPRDRARERHRRGGARATSRRWPSRSSSRPCATRASTPMRRRVGVSLRNDGGTLRARGAQRRSPSAQRRPGRASACAWRRSRRSSTAACSSTASPSRGPGRCASWCRPASEHARACTR